MKCAKFDDVVLYLTEQSRGDRGAELETHLRECAGCRQLVSEIESLTGRLAPDPGEFDDEQLVGDVMTLVRLGQARKEKVLNESSRLSSVFRIGIPAVAAALVVCTLAAVVLSLRSGGDDEGLGSPALMGNAPGFQARGGADDNPEKRVSFKLFKATASGYRQETAKIAIHDSLAFAYDNRSQANYRYLMIFGVDHRGEVFWYYPAYDSVNENPKSISIRQSSNAIELPDEIKHNLSPGKLRVFALFSQKPLDVNSVEKRIGQDFKQHGRIELLKRLSGYDIAQQSFLLEVAKR